jgi:hypothetical protein
MPTVDVLAHEFAELARELRRAGDDELRRELQDAISHAAAPVPEQIREELPARLPNPYAAVLNADLIIRITSRTARSNPGVRITAPERTRSVVTRRRLIRLDQGVLAHPLFGNRRHWYTQPVTAGFFTQPAEDSAPRARQDIEEALDRVKEKIYAGVHG